MHVSGLLVLLESLQTPVKLLLFVLQEVMDGDSLTTSQDTSLPPSAMTANTCRPPSPSASAQRALHVQGRLSYLRVRISLAFRRWLQAVPWFSQRILFKELYFNSFLTFKSFKSYILPATAAQFTGFGWRGCKKDYIFFWKRRDETTSNEDVRLHVSTCQFWAQFKGWEFLSCWLMITKKGILSTLIFAA